MKKGEIKSIVKILLMADGGCEYCSKELIKEFIKTFGQKELVKKVVAEIKRGDD